MEKKWICYTFFGFTVDGTNHLICFLYISNVKQTILIAFTIISLNSISQSFTIQDNYMSLSGQYTDNDFSKNTFLEALLDDSLTWEIVVDSMPSTWEFSNCFPNCYNVGVTSGDLVVLNGQSYYLNCHIYPNNTAGEGLITMKISNYLVWFLSLSSHTLSHSAKSCQYTLNG